MQHIRQAIDEVTTDVWGFLDEHKELHTEQLDLNNPLFDPVFLNECIMLAARACCAMCGPRERFPLAQQVCALE